ncbi:MAG: hypothetical protein RL323_1693, partial [Pseudomonadota bacterium]
SWWMTKRKKLQPWVGLPNILGEAFWVPELLQEAATPKALAAATMEWLANNPGTAERRQKLTQRFEQMHHELKRDTRSLAADAIEKILAA